MKNGIVTIENVSVTYSNGHNALDNVSLTLRKGSVCGLVGVNGAGKSTLFKAIMGFTKPTSGNIEIAGSSVKSALKRNAVAYVPQSENVDWNFPVRVEDVVMMGRYSHMCSMRVAKKADKLAVTESLERVGMIRYRKRQIGELSGGQKKRVFVARALAQGAEIILLDEPFTGVDLNTEESLTNLFKDLAKNGNLIFVSTHNLGSVPELCDEVVLLNREVIAHGSVGKTFTQENLIKTFGGKLRHHQLFGHDLHDDSDTRGVTVFTDDERPLVLYGEMGGQKIVKPPPCCMIIENSFDSAMIDSDDCATQCCKGKQQGSQ